MFSSYVQALGIALEFLLPKVVPPQFAVITMVLLRLLAKSVHLSARIVCEIRKEYIR